MRNLILFFLPSLSFLILFPSFHKNSKFYPEKFWKSLTLVGSEKNSKRLSLRATSDRKEIEEIFGIEGSVKIFFMSRFNLNYIFELKEKKGRIKLLEQYFFLEYFKYCLKYSKNDDYYLKELHKEGLEKKIFMKKNFNFSKIEDLINSKIDFLESFFYEFLNKKKEPEVFKIDDYIDKNFVWQRINNDFVREKEKINNKNEYFLSNIKRLCNKDPKEIFFNTIEDGNFSFKESLSLSEKENNFENVFLAEVYFYLKFFEILIKDGSYFDLSDNFLKKIFKVGNEEGIIRKSFNFYEQSFPKFFETIKLKIQYVENELNNKFNSLDLFNLGNDIDFYQVTPPCEIMENEY